MRAIFLKDKMEKGFIFEVLQIKHGNPFNLQVSDDNVYCQNPVILNMIQRLINKETAVLPFHMGSYIIWLVLNSDAQKLVKHAEEIKNFIVPTFAEPFSRMLKKFSADKKGIGQLGDRLFPEGYYSYRSPVNLVESVLKYVDLWSHLDNQRPEFFPEETEINAYVLRAQFQQAISLQQWEEARQILNIIKQGHHLSDENCQFLKVQLLSSQGRWKELWESPDFRVISGLDPLPTAVRRALITTF